MINKFIHILNKFNFHLIAKLDYTCLTRLESGTINKGNVNYLHILSD